MISWFDDDLMLVLIASPLKAEQEMIKFLVVPAKTEVLGRTILTWLLVGVIEQPKEPSPTLSQMSRVNNGVRNGFLEDLSSVCGVLHDEDAVVLCVTRPLKLCPQEVYHIPRR
uniref:Secreted protein n=1 Tax=Steinernema glaseri TaxID=37863 RepID=A0A1I8A4M3_9BILA